MAGTPAADLPLIPSGIGCHHHDLLLLLSLLNLGCLFFCLPPSSDQPPPPRRRKISPFAHPEPSHPAAAHPQRRGFDPAKPALGPSDNSGKSFSVSIRSYLRHLFSFSAPSPLQQESGQQWHPTAASLQVANPASTHRGPPQQQLRHYLLSPDKSITPCSSPAKSIGALDTCAAVGPVKRPSFASRADIYPCALCGEIFNKAHLLDLHQATRHAFSELSDGDSGKNIVTIIFRSGWKGGDDAARGGPVIHRVLKIHHSPRTLARFEEYRDAVRSRAAVGGADERCVVDGNERLRFYCATFLCGLAREGDPGTCDSPFCAACGVVRHGFSGKDADGISTHATAWTAHASLPEELEREFAFMHVRRAMLVCRVVAGRVAPGKTAPPVEADDGAYEYDSVVAAAAGGRDGGGPWTGEGELVVFNARAVLPCFVVVYSGV
ncbi:hypothetical protein Taro_033425 [Colocasia esculenta]|uniref:C2H2-type domain-containing protein n=1 Tax=Colocasia esculenta TaxID=4460 RepID=A0A843W045_COLES|nr:hypothetical protein [Colocasia esculenta]